MYELEDDDEFEYDDDYSEDFVKLKTGDFMTNGSQWEAIIARMLSGKKIYHRYNTIDIDDTSEHEWRKDSMLSRLPKRKQSLLATEQIMEGEFVDYLNTIESPDEDDLGPDEVYYCVWYLKPLNNQNVLSCLKKDNINISYMRRWLDEQRDVISTSMGEDIGMD